MYVCTICGMKKSELGTTPEFEFRHRRHPNEESQLEGMSDWCSKCEALRFFFKSNVEDPSQQLDEQQPKKRLANHALEATIKCWTNGNKDAGASPHRTTRRDAHKILMQEVVAGLPSQLPRGSLWERKLRSFSEDRSPRSQRVKPTIDRRSKSAVNETPRQKAKLAEQQAERRSHQVKDVFLKPDKHVQLDIPTPKEAKGQNNVLEELARHKKDDADDDSSRSSSPRFRIRMPFEKRQLNDLVSPWKDQIEHRIHQLITECPKKKRTKATRGDKEDRRSETAGKRERREVNTTGKRISKDEMLRNIQKLQETEMKQQLKTKLKEKKHQMTEWKRIRRRVEDEYDRVKAELHELEYQADLDIERHRRNKLKVKDRMTGGAHILALTSNNDDKTKTLNEKTIGVALDEKMKSMLDTLQEVNEQKASSEQKNEAILKPTSSPVNEESTDLQAENVEGATISPLSKPKRVLSKLNILVSTVQRARFRGFPEDPQELLKRLDQSEFRKQCEPPLPQFQTMPCARQDLVNLLHIKRDVLQPNRIRPLKVCRSPIYCPDCDCRRMFFISDFNEHLTHEHPSLAMERIAPCQAKTFFMDTHATLLNKAKCNMVYFVKDKFIDGNTNNHPDLLPVLVMSARLRLTELFNPQYDPTAQLRPIQCHGPDNEIFLIWLTSVRPDDAKIIGTISIWPTSSNPLVEYLLVHTNEVYNIRSSQKLKNIYNSNRIVILSGSLVSRMTDGGKNLLAIQVLIH